MTGDFDLGLFFCVEGGATMKKRWGGNRGLEERMGRERRCWFTNLPCGMRLMRVSK